MKQIIDFEDKLIDSNSIIYKDKKLNCLLEKNIAVAFFNSNKTINTEWFIPKFENANIIGNKLMLKNGRIYIGKGVKKVKVNASLFLENVNYNNVVYLWAFICKNNSRIYNSIMSGVSMYYNSVNITDCIIDVKENDYLYLTVNNPSYATFKSSVIRAGINESRLYVEVIEVEE